MAQKVMLTGCSGVGKTTLAKWINLNFGIQFISGSYSDLVPETKSQKHSEMINKDPKEVYAQDLQVVNLRNKSFKDKHSFVSDRSYFDSVAYLIQKLSHNIHECDTESFIHTCEHLMAEQCTHLIYIPFSTKFLSGWEMEDNSKRVLNRYYQFEVSQILNGVLDLWHFKENKLKSKLKYKGNKYGYIYCRTHNHNTYPPIKVLILDELDWETRCDLVSKFLNE